MQQIPWSFNCLANQRVRNQSQTKQRIFWDEEMKNTRKPFGRRDTKAPWKKEISDFTFTPQNLFFRSDVQGHPRIHQTGRATIASIFHLNGARSLRATFWVGWRHNSMKINMNLDQVRTLIHIGLKRLEIYCPTVLIDMTSLPLSSAMSSFLLPLANQGLSLAGCNF